MHSGHGFAGWFAGHSSSSFRLELMADATQLQEKFDLPGVLRFEPSPSGLVFLHVSLPSAEATLCTQGAHLMQWQPAGHDPVLYLSQRATYAPGKAIRGGIPIIFPWFGDRHEGRSGPAHGFARTSEWDLAFVALTGPNENPELHLDFTLAPSELSRSLGFDHFRAGCRFTIGRELRIDFSVVNSTLNPAPLTFEQALHTYFAVADVGEVSLDGLGGATYIDKVDGNVRRTQPPGPLRFTGRTDRPYLNTEAACILHDPEGKRTITIAKHGSLSTVVWNPWQELTATMHDMQPDDWMHMVCIETANVADNALTLQPGEGHLMHLTVSVEKTAQ
jgi:glucose-6-phosphate 1-epimerase